MVGRPSLDIPLFSEEPRCDNSSFNYYATEAVANENNWSLRKVL